MTDHDIERYSYRDVPVPKFDDLEEIDEFEDEYEYDNDESFEDSTAKDVSAPSLHESDSVTLSREALNMPDVRGPDLSWAIAC